MRITPQYTTNATISGNFLVNMLKLLTKISLSEMEIVASNDKSCAHMFMKTEVFKRRKNLVREDKLIVHAPIL